MLKHAPWLWVRPTGGSDISAASASLCTRYRSARSPATALPTQHNCESSSISYRCARALPPRQWSNSHAAIAARLAKVALEDSWRQLVRLFDREAAAANSSAATPRTAVRMFLALALVREATPGRRGRWWVILACVPLCRSRSTEACREVVGALHAASGTIDARAVALTSERAHGLPSGTGAPPREAAGATPPCARFTPLLVTHSLRHAACRASGFTQKVHQCPRMVSQIVFSLFHAAQKLKRSLGVRALRCSR